MKSISIHQRIELCTTAIVSRYLFIQPATKIADVALGANKKDGHLQRCAVNGNQADDTLLLGYL